MKKTLTVMALCLGLSTMAFAQNRTTRPGTDRTNAQPQRQMGNTGDMYDTRDNTYDRYYSNDMKLDDSQRKQMDDLMERRDNDLNDLNDRYNDPLSEYRTERQELDKRYDEEYRNMLSPDQQKRYDTRVKEREERRQQMMERGSQGREERMQDR